MLAGELYIADDPQLAADNLRALKLAKEFNTSDPADAQARLALLRELLGSVGEGTEIRPPLYCDYGYQTHIGARTFINFGVVLLDVATIQIGDDVQVGPNAQFLTPTHPAWRPRPAGPGGRPPSRSASGTTSGWAAGCLSVPGSASGRTRWSGPGRWWSGTCPPTWSRSATPPG
jgi:maltose O-acetyltransferase